MNLCKLCKKNDRAKFLCNGKIKHRGVCKTCYTEQYNERYKLHGGTYNDYDVLFNELEIPLRMRKQLQKDYTISEIKQGTGEGENFSPAELFARQYIY